jgi:hypothetical protein
MPSSGRPRLACAARCIFRDRAQQQTAAVNQNGTVTFKPLVLQAGYQLFDCRLIAGDQQQTDLRRQRMCNVFESLLSAESNIVPAFFPDTVT